MACAAIETCAVAPSYERTLLRDASASATACGALQFSFAHLKEHVLEADSEKQEAAKKKIELAAAAADCCPCI